MTVCDLPAPRVTHPTHVPHVTNLSLLICPTDTGPSVIFRLSQQVQLSFDRFFSRAFVTCLGSWDACHTPIAV